MSMDLNGAGGYFKTSNECWRQLLRLAHDYGGWEPMGVWQPTGDWIADARFGDGRMDEERTMNYFTNDFQLVCDEDARNLADAVERSLSDVPAFMARIDNKAVEAMTPPEWFCGHGRDLLRDFVAFARSGAFRIS
jgi:hypothetical protein